MPIAVSHSATSRERRVGSGGSSSRSVSVGGKRGKSGSTASKSSSSNSAATSSTSHPPPILRTSSPSSPPVKGILVNNSSSDHHHNEQDTIEHHQEDNVSNTASSYLKPLLKYLPRHIDPSTIARLLKNVHPSAFGSYRTKEAWRREHPQVLDAAYSLQNGEDTESTHAVIRPSISSDEACLAHSPPSATFSSSEDDGDGEGDFDEDYISYGLHRHDNNGEDDDDEYDRREAKELEDYFNDEFDADLGTSPESASSLRDLHQNNQNHQYSHGQLAWNGNTSSNSTSTSSSRRTSTTRRVRSNSQDSTTTSATAKNDSNPSSASSHLEEEPATATSSLTSPRSPLAIYLSKPDEEHDSPLAGPSQRVLDAYYNNHNDEDSTSSVLDESNDSGATITFSNLHAHSQAYKQSSASSAEDHYHHHQAIASTSAAILYPDFRRRDSVELTPKTPPSPSGSGSPSPSPSPSSPSSSSLPPSPSSLSPSSHYTTATVNNNARRSPSATSSNRSHSYSVTHPYGEKPRSPSQQQPQQSQNYPTLPTNIPRIIKRQTSSSSLASSSKSACTCRSTNSAISNASVSSSRSSSIKFAPLPEEEIAIARRESRNRNGNGAGNDKSRVMGIKGRRNLLLGIGVDNDSRSNEDDDDRSPVPDSSSSSSTSPSYTTGRSNLDESEEENSIAEDSDEDDDEEYSYNSRSRRTASKDQFDALAYFGEEDLLNPPPPALSHRGKNSATALKSNSDKKTTNDSVKTKKNRKDSDVTIRLGKNGELIERRPLGVTLEELTLPMKRVKETRGRSRQTNDLSASFTSPTKILSPPLSPSHSSTSTTSSCHTFSPPLSPARTSKASTQDEAMSSQIENGLISPDASHEKTPMPTPRLEKKRLDMFTSVTPVSPPSSRSTFQAAGSSNKGLAISSPTSTALNLPLSPTTSHPDYSASSTSPTHSSHSNAPSSSSNGGSNEITPMPTPRAGSPIAGLKMTTSIFEERGQAQSRGFKLVDTVTTSKTSGSRSNIRADDDDDAAANEGKEGELKVSTVANILALGGLLDDSLSSDLSTLNTHKPTFEQQGSVAPSRETDEQALKSDSENDHAAEEEMISENDETSEDGDESDFNDHDKTPTLHASLDLPKLNETTHALQARYRKKRSVGIPHGVTAKKKSVTSSRKSKKT